MDSIQQKISKPYFFLVIAIPLSICLLFNLLVLLYTYNDSRENLENVGTSITHNLNAFPKMNDDDELGLLALIGRSNLTSYTEILAFNQAGKLLYPTTFEDTFLTADIIEKAYETATIENSPIHFLDGLQIYHAMEIEYSGKQRIARVIYLSAGELPNKYIFAINGILLIVSIFTMILFSFLSRKIAKEIAHPITEIAQSLSTFQNDSLILLPQNTSSEEVALLVEKLNDLSRKVYQYNQSQKSFLHNASHELRTPLMNIQGYADGIEMGIFNDAKGTAHLISNHTKDLTRLVDKLLTLARAENFDQQHNLKEINLGHFLTEFIHSSTSYAKAQNIAVNLKVVENVLVMASEELLREAIGNIVSNGIRYAKTQINISLTLKDKVAVVTIRDDGEGIQQIEEIFNRFHRGEKGNFGLGLSIAQTAVTKMSGTILPYNDHGAVFEITLPIKP